MGAPWIALLCVAAYVVLAVALDGPAHRLVYPLVGYGHPLEGRRRWLVRLFGPLIILGIGTYCVPMMLVLILVGISWGKSGGR